MCNISNIPHCTSLDGNDIENEKQYCKRAYGRKELERQTRRPDKQHGSHDRKYRGRCAHHLGARIERHAQEKRKYAACKEHSSGSALPDLIFKAVAEDVEENHVAG